MFKNVFLNFIRVTLFISQLPMPCHPISHPMFLKSMLHILANDDHKSACLLLYAMYCTNYYGRLLGDCLYSLHRLSKSLRWMHSTISSYNSVMQWCGNTAGKRQVILHILVYSVHESWSKDHMCRNILPLHVGMQMCIFYTFHIRMLVMAASPQWHYAIFLSKSDWN